MTYTKITADTITVAQIKQLREEAREHSDYQLETIASCALASHELHDSDGHLLTDYDGDPITRTDAREFCAAAINAALEMAVCS